MGEIKNILFLHKDSEKFKTQFCNHVSNENEKSKERELSQKVLNFYQKVYDNNAKSIKCDYFDYDFSGYGYIDNFGYYIVSYDGWGYYYVICYEEQTDKAFVNIVQSILTKKRDTYLQDNKKSIKKEYRERFNNKQCSQFAFEFEYDLDKWNKFYDGNIPDDLMQIYQRRIDFFNDYSIYSNNKMLEYDKSTNKIIEKNISKTRKLTK